ncbi:glucosamine-6-phosphate deaminase [Escherichia coli]|nr:glucosamine-6-phosphate deaminase [Escherichia coli]
MKPTRFGAKRERLLIDAPRDKRTYFREINYIAAAFQYQKKNYNSA